MLMTVDPNGGGSRSVAEVLSKVEALTRRIGLSRKDAIVLAVILIAAVTGAIAAVVCVWNWIGYADMDRHGYIALAIGVTATLGLGIGLMGLMFYSARHGYDDRY